MTIFYLVVMLIGKSKVSLIESLLRMLIVVMIWPFALIIGVLHVSSPLYKD
jgi:hypothetical protein